MLEGPEAEEEQKARTELLKTTDTMVSSVAGLLGAGVLPLAGPLQLSGKSSYDWIACITFRPGGHACLVMLLD